MYNPVVMACTLAVYEYSIVVTDGSPSTSPRVEVAAGLVTLRRAGGPAKIVERLQSWQNGGEASEKALLERQP